MDLLRRLLLLSTVFCQLSFAAINYDEPIDTDNVKKQQQAISALTTKLGQQLTEQQLQDILFQLNLSSGRVSACIQSHQAGSNESISEIEAALLAQCEDMADQIDTLKQELNSQLNRYSFERYKSRLGGVFSDHSSNDSTISIQKIFADKSLTLALASIIFYAVFWILLKLLSDKFSSLKSHWVTTAILGIGFLGYLLLWFYDNKASTTLEYWFGITMASLLFFSWQANFKWPYFISTTFIVGTLTLTHNHFLAANSNPILVTPYHFDSMMLVAWLICYRLLFRHLSSTANYWFYSATSLLLLLDLFGYHAISHQVTLSLLVIRLSWQTVHLIYRALPSLVGKAYQLMTYLKWVNVAQCNLDTLPGRSWVNWGLATYVFLTIFITQLPLLGLPLYYSDQLAFAIKNDFSIGTINISIYSLVTGIVIFGLLLSLSKILQSFLEHRVTRNNDSNANEAMAAIFWYSAVVTSALVALSIAGFSVQNLALVAGAFSIGIGFGLQNIVSNFVSGLILLIERPIKKGDWVVIGSTEGLVKKVSIRATEIQTFDRADIIVPNSDLITNQVTNWMLNDRIGRIKIPVGVAYGSPTDKVKEILLNIASNHSDLIQDQDRYPIHIIFSNFGESSLDFEIRAFLHDIANIHKVRSELNFATDAAFRENNIEIPFPQRDLHIRSDDTRKE